MLIPPLFHVLDPFFPPSILSALHPEHGQVVGGQEPVPVVGPDKLFQQAVGHGLGDGGAVDLGGVGRLVRVLVVEHHLVQQTHVDGVLAGGGQLGADGRGRPVHQLPGARGPELLGPKVDGIKGAVVQVR